MHGPAADPLFGVALHAVVRSTADGVRESGECSSFAELDRGVGWSRKLRRAPTIPVLWGARQVHAAARRRVRGRCQANSPRGEITDDLNGACSRACGAEFLVCWSIRRDSPGADFALQAVRAAKWRISEQLSDEFGRRVSGEFARYRRRRGRRRSQPDSENQCACGDSEFRKRCRGLHRAEALVAARYRRGTSFKISGVEKRMNSARSCQPYFSSDAASTFSTISVPVTTTAAMLYSSPSMRTVI